MTPDAVIDLASQDWFSDRAAQRPYVENILYRRRGWSWITEGDARTPRRPVAGEVDLPAGADRRSGEAARCAWARRWRRRRGSAPARIPEPEAFMDTKAIDVRGLPVWEIDRWTTF